MLTQKLSRHILDIVSEKSYSQSEVNEMDGSHSKDTIPLEPEGYRRSEKNFTVYFGQLFGYNRVDCGFMPFLNECTVCGETFLKGIRCFYLNLG